MPNVTAPSRPDQNGQTSTNFTDTVSASSVTYTYPVQQSGITIINKGNAALTLTVGNQSFTIQGSSVQSVAVAFTSFDIASTSGIQAFEARSVSSSNQSAIGGITRVLAFSTATPLAANAAYTSPTIDAINYKTYTLFGTSDAAGTYFLQISDDGVTWYNSTTASQTIPANGVSSAAGAAILFRYTRIVFTNGAAPQTTFKLGLYLSPL